ncbi:MAG: PilN domain-containing protein [Candidatus Omnitrophica bacterium]|nr:PilN domain-containing protein [Candidatus Omnitrophota bacterium]
MIEINLLPPQLRKKEPVFKLAIPRETLYLVGGAILAILIFIHIILIGALTVRSIRYSNLNRIWQGLLPDKEKIDALNKEQKKISERTNSIAKLTKKGRVSWAKKLNMISDVVPQGVWLRRIEFTGTELIIEGSSVSLKGEEVILVNRFSSALKNNKDFYSDFKDMELDSIKQRQIKNMEVADFILVTKLKEK